MQYEQEFIHLKMCVQWEYFFSQCAFLLKLIVERIFNLKFLFSFLCKTSFFFVPFTFVILTALHCNTFWVSQLKASLISLRVTFDWMKDDSQNFLLNRNKGSTFLFSHTSSGWLWLDLRVMKMLVRSWTKPERASLQTDKCGSQPLSLRRPTATLTWWRGSLREVSQARLKSKSDSESITTGIKTACSKTFETGYIDP